MLAFLIIIIILALIFDYINGFHDAANSIATIVSTKVLTPFQAVIWAAAFNFIAFFIFREHKVAGTIANIVSENIINFKVLVSATLAAIGWNLLPGIMVFPQVLRIRLSAALPARQWQPED